MSVAILVGLVVLLSVVSVGAWRISTAGERDRLGQQFATELLPIDGVVSSEALDEDKVRAMFPYRVHSDGRTRLVLAASRLRAAELTKEGGSTEISCLQLIHRVGRLTDGRWAVMVLPWWLYRLGKPCEHGFGCDQR